MATMKEIFPLIRDGKLWTGYTHPKQFLQPDGSYKKFGNCLWWTNLPVKKEMKFNPDIQFSLEKYPLYDNYNAFNVDKLSEIPTNFETVVTEEQLQMLRERGIDLEIIEEIDE